MLNVHGVSSHVDLMSLAELRVKKKIFFPNRSPEMMRYNL